MRVGEPVVRYNAAFGGAKSTKKPCFLHFSEDFVDISPVFSRFCRVLPAFTGHVGPQDPWKGSPTAG
jgi:hypothetical protein